MNTGSAGDDIEYHKMFYSEDDSTKELLQELTDVHHMVHQQPTDIHKLDVLHNIRYCVLLIRLADAIVNKKGGAVCTKQPLFWKFDGRVNPALFHEIAVHVIDTANIFLGTVSHDERLNHTKFSDDDRAVKFEMCREVVGLLNWTLKNVYASGKTRIYEERNYGMKRATELRGWCRAYGLWNTMQRYSAKIAAADSKEIDHMDMLMAIRLGRTCCALLRNQPSPELNLMFKGRFFISKLTNGCLGTLILNDHDKRHSPITEAEDVRKRGRWSEAVFTEYILMAAQQKELLGETGDAISFYNLAFLNNRYVHGLEEKRKKNQNYLNKVVRSPHDAVEALDGFTLLSEEETMPRGHDPLKASNMIDNDVTQFVL